MLRGRVPAAFWIAVACVLSGCSGNSLGMGHPTNATATAAAPAAPAAPAPSLSDKIETFFGTSKPPPPTATAGGPPPAAPVDCPFIDIRQGASTLTIPPPPPDGSNEAMTLKYQGSFVRAARDCKLVGAEVVMRLGVEGRIIAGPAGGPGDVAVPLRIAVVDQSTTGSKLITTKLVMIPVTLGPGEGSKAFVHVEDNLTFPLPPRNEIDRYLVFIGFDPIGAEGQEKTRHAPPRGKPKPHANPNAPTG